MVGGDSKFMLTRTHVHMFPHTHNSYLEAEQRQRSHTHSPNGGRDLGKKRSKRPNTQLLDQKLWKFFRRCRQLGDSTRDLEGLSLQSFGVFFAKHVYIFVGIHYLIYSLYFILYNVLILACLYSCTYKLRTQDRDLFYATHIIYCVTTNAVLNLCMICCPFWWMTIVSLCRHRRKNFLSFYFYFFSQIPTPIWRMCV